MSCITHPNRLSPAKAFQRHFSGTNKWNFSTLGKPIVKYDKNFHLNHMTNYLLPGRMMFSHLSLGLGLGLNSLSWRWRHLHHLRWGGGTSTTSGDESTMITSSPSLLQRQEPSVTLHSHYNNQEHNSMCFNYFTLLLSPLVTNLLILMDLLELQYKQT